jgi:AmmeMemoRadiSam system protein B
VKSTFKEETRIRPCAACGLFYPGDATELREEVRLLLDESPEHALAGTVRGLVSPHAGYQYSGRTAACGYRLLQGRVYGAVVIVSPSHREYFDGVCVYSGDAYSTPLGEVEIHREFRDHLLSVCDCVESGLKGHRSEHAIEVQLPFLQEALGDFRLVPIVIGDQRPELCLLLGEGLAKMARGENVLFIASTDLSHYHSGDVANALDAVVMQDVGKGDYRTLLEDLAAGRAEACGGGPTASVLAALDLLGVRTIEVLNHSTSGDVTGDYREVVGYLSAVAYS